MYGCDICQDVCPWNRFSQPHQEPKFLPGMQLQNMDEKEWKEMTQDVFSEVFRKSAVKRTKFSGLTRNIRILEEAKKRSLLQIEGKNRHSLSKDKEEFSDFLLK